MNINKKSSGFFIIEILIVLVIVGILVIAMLPNYTTYTNRAKFVDVINAAGAIRPSVDSCILQFNTAGSAITNCGTAPGVTPTSGVPTVLYTAAGLNVSALSVLANGTITGTSSVALGSYTYIMIPTYNAQGQVTWADGTGTCKAQGLC